VSLVAKALGAFANWALSKNAPGSYKDEDDPRWAYTIATDGDEYLTRVLAPKWLRRVIGCRPYLHKFHREDLDRHLHNHPWKWAFSIILCGSYDEVRLDHELTEASRALGEPRDYTVRRRVRWFNVLTDADYHKVEHLHGEVWTLFITGPRVQGWGFRVDGRHVPDGEYLGKANK